MTRPYQKLFLAFLMSVLILGLVPVSAYAASSSDVVIGNSYTLERGGTLNDDLLIMGGSVNLEDGSMVNGSVVLLGGSLNASGTVTGDVLVLGGSVNLAATFVLRGNLTSAGTVVNRHPGAQILGDIYTAENAQQVFTLPGGFHITTLDGTSNPVFGVAGFFLRLFLWVLAAMVVAMFIPTHLARISHTALSQPLTSWGLGLLTIIVVPIVLVLLVLTICLIPVSILIAFLLALAWAFGLIALGVELGVRISKLSGRDWHPVLSAGLGTLVLMLLLNGLEAVVPCVGWIPKILVGLLGLGAVLLTQFGMKPYPSEPLLPPLDPGTIQIS